MKPAAPAGSRAGLALALLCLAAPARADELCTSWLSAHERCHDAHATGDDASCCEGSDIQASCQWPSATGWWDNRRLSAVDEPRRLGHCCDYGAYCSCMESELGAAAMTDDDDDDEDGDEDERATALHWGRRRLGADTKLFTTRRAAWEMPVPPMGDRPAAAIRGTCGSGTAEDIAIWEPSRW